jgi:hypothetical protein
MAGAGVNANSAENVKEPVLLKDSTGAFRNENRRTCWIYFKPTPAGFQAGFTFIRHAVE